MSLGLPDICIKTIPQSDRAATSRIAGFVKPVISLIISAPLVRASLATLGLEVSMDIKV